ncbi:hypothetical protein ACQKCU_13810 [Heyndrickxia sporothermodurans]
MRNIFLKITALILLLILFFFSFLYLYKPSNHYEKVVIVEKYYALHSNGKAKGIKTKKSVPVISADKDQPACLMEFDNGKILDMDCDIYLQFSIGEKVKIKYSKHHLIDIRRK